jgi:hypothetical protein
MISNNLSGAVRVFSGAVCGLKTIQPKTVPKPSNHAVSAPLYDRILRVFSELLMIAYMAPFEDRHKGTTR